MANSKFDHTIYDGMSEYDAMDILIDNIEEYGKPLDKINHFMSLINNAKLRKSLQYVIEKHIPDKNVTDDDIANYLRSIRDEDAICGCEECVAQALDDCDKTVKIHSQESGVE